MAMYPQIRVNESTKIIRTSTKYMGGNEVRIAEKREGIERYSVQKEQETKSWRR